MVAHGHKAIEAAGGIQCHTNHDQQAGTAQLNAHTGQVAQNDRQYSHRSQEDGTDEGDLVQGAGDEIAGRLAGTEAGDRAVVAAQIVGDLNGVVLDGHIEVVECQNQQQVDHNVQPGGVVEGMEERIPDRVSGLIDLQKAADSARDGHQSRSEDDGHDAAHVQLQGQVAVLAAHLLPTHHTLGVLDGDPALGVRDEHDEHNDQQHAENQQDRGVPLDRAGGQRGNERADERRDTGNDTCEQDHRDAVADAELVNLLAHPHQEGRAGHEGHDDDKACEEAGLVEQVVVLEHHIVCKAHQKSKADRGVAGDALDLLLAFLAALLGKTLKSRDGDGNRNGNGPGTLGSDF